MENQIVKMYHITTVQSLENMIDGNPSGFDFLNKMNIESLELLKDELIIEYNWLLEERQKVNK